MVLKRLQTIIDTFNSYYSFALVLYAAVLYVSSHNNLFLFIAIATLPVLAAWGGYLVSGYLRQRNQRFGFKINSVSATYEVLGNHHYTDRVSMNIEACDNHLMLYPFGYRWTGDGPESVPQLSDPEQSLLAPVKQESDGKIGAEVRPYVLRDSTQGEWRYWFVTFENPLHKGDKAEIKYTAKFFDRRNKAVPRSGYFVKFPVKKLELNVKFERGTAPHKVSCSYIKPSDPTRPRKGSGIEYDPDNLWARWVIDNPKLNYYYRITWE